MGAKFAAMLAGASLFALALPAAAQQDPQDQNAAAEGENEQGEIVVTGTYIRGIAPTGNQILGLTAEDVQASGGVSTNDVLSSIPQLSTMFNALNQVGLSGASGATTINQNAAAQTQRPVLRNIGSNTLGSTPTLVLMDGHRMVGVGVNQASPDAGVIPPSLLERVEIVTDGGTALYGTDAVGGVLNFITRRSFDGIRASARYGVGDEYDAYDASLTAGKDWDTGSVFASVSYNETDPIFGVDRDWYSHVNWNNMAPFGRYLTGELRQCAQPNVTVGSTNYAVTGPDSIGPANSFNPCEITDYQTISPESNSTSFFAGLTQELADGIEFGVRGFYTERITKNTSGASVGTVRVDDETANSGSPGASPYYVDVPGALANGAIQTVQFNYEPYDGNGLSASFANTELWTWQITPTLTFDLPADWRLSTLVSYGQSETFYRNRAVNADRQQYYATGGAVPIGASAPALTYNTVLGPTGNNFNPYDIGGSNPAVLADILNWQRYGWARQAMTNYRAVFDGPLLTLPGGDLRVAVGAEYIKEEIERRAGFTNIGNEGSLIKPSTDRNVTAFFAELNIPIVGEGNRLPLVESLVLSLSARRDDYSDFGETTNPQVGLSWEPTKWLVVRGSWGQSFNAPSAVEVLDKEFPIVSISNRVFNWGNLEIPGSHTNIAGGAPDLGPCPTGPDVCTAPTTPATFRSLIIGGARPDLEPQTGETWSVGFELSPPFLSNLRLSSTYYHISFEDTLSSFANVSFQTTQTNYDNWNSLLFINGTDGTGPSGAFTSDDITTFCAQALNPADCAGLAADPGSVYFIADTRLGNFGATVQEGVDVALRYSHDFDWGALDAGLAGNYRILSRNRTPGTTLWTETDMDTLSRYNYSANVGVTMGDFYGRLTMNYSDGWNLNFNNGAAQTATSTGPFQYHVEAFKPVDLFLRYDLGQVNVADSLRVTLNIDNLFDDEPPQLRQTGTTGIANGSTLGRVVTVGLSADF